ncbi:ABC transporter substrate-binding protein [Azospirillum endophyticum]
MTTITNWTPRDDRRIEDAMRRGASRRELLQMFMAGGIGLAAGSTILGRAAAALADTPVKGGHLIAASWSASTADTLDPAKASLSTDYVRCCSLYSRLTVLDQAGSVRMELADSIETSDARVWTVKLKRGVTFHNGKTLTAADVVFSLRRHLDPQVASKVAAIAKPMTEIEVLDTATVKITLAAPNADLPTILAMHHFMIVADGTTDFSKGIGTGAFRLERFEPGTRSVMSRNEDYFGTPAPLKSFEFFAVADDAVRANALLSGDVQIAANMKPAQLRLLETQPGVVLERSIAGNYTNLNMRLDTAPGDRADFIAGMRHLVNRTLIQKSVLRGISEPGNDQPVPPSSPYFNPELAAPAYDPEKAKTHFKKAGLLGQAIPLVASDAAVGSIEMATIVQQAGGEVGMNFQINRVPSDGYWANYWLKAPVHFGNINPRPTPDILFSLLYASDAPWNESHYRSERFDRLLVEARGSLDDTRRKQIYAEMQGMIATEAGTIIPAYISNVDALSHKVKGMRKSPLGNLEGYAFVQNVWLEA